MRSARRGHRFRFPGVQLMRGMLPIALACLLMLPPAAGQAIHVVRYAQQLPGSATGELFVEELAEGPLRIRTPGRADLHAGVKRMGDRALIRIVDAGKRKDIAELKIVLLQGETEKPLTFPLAVPEKPSEPAVPTEPSPARARPAQAGPEPENRARKKPAREAAPPAETRTVAAAAPGRAEARTASPCPALVVTPGSLYATTARLAAECGYALGRWAPGDEEVLLDFEVDELNIVDNPDGVAGLLALLRRYGLVGLVRPGTRLIDIFEHRKTEP